MLPVNKKIVQILKLNFGINYNSVSEDTNLIKEFNLCDWELELLYLKLEAAFNIELQNEVPEDDICMRELLREIRANIYGKKA
jgi:hypothetical protein